MIGRVLGRGARLARLVYYLFGPGKACEHVNPHVVAGFRHPAELEPPAAGAPGRARRQRDFRRLTGLLMQPVEALGRRAPDKPVWHCVIRAAPGDPDLGDGAWMKIAAEVMHRTGLSRRGEEGRGVRWFAVHHGDNHIHIVATLARQDGGRARLDNDYYRIGEALRDIEAEYGLVAVARADRTASRAPTRAEAEKAARAGQAEPPRVTLRRHVAAAAAGARSEPEFFAALASRGVQVRLRYSDRDPGEVTGYAVTVPGACTAAGDPVWFGGGKLAPDLTLPKLRRRWAGPGSRGPGPGVPGPGARLHGGGMTNAAARAALRREAGLCAAGARSEPEFFAALEAAGLLVRIRPGEDRPGEAAGYAVSLPGLLHRRDGTQVWYGGRTLAPHLALGAMRRRWRAGRAGAPPVGAFDGAETADIFAYAAAAAADAVRRLRVGPGRRDAADIAWAAADVLYAAADATGSDELRAAADSFSRAARAPWGRIPAPSPAGGVLRTAAYLLASCTPGRTRRRITRVALTGALTGLAGEIAALRQQQRRLAQAEAAGRAAAGLAAAAPPPGGPDAAVLTRAPAAARRPFPGRPRPRPARRPPPAAPSPGPRRPR